MFVGQYIIGQNLAKTCTRKSDENQGGNKHYSNRWMHGHIDRTNTKYGSVLDSGCTKTVCSKTWLNCSLESLSSEELDNIKSEWSETIFKFGNGKICHSIKQITIPVVIAGQNVLLTTKAIENDIPLLLSKDTMKKDNTYIDFANKIIR